MLLSQHIALSDAQIERAIAFNKRVECRPFLCQATFERIDPRTPEGVQWVAQVQDLFDDESWTKKPKASYYDPSRRVKVDGMFGGQTQSEYIKRYGPLSETPSTLHPMPVLGSLWRYDHAYDPGQVEWPSYEPEWETFTHATSWVNAMLRLVSGYKGRGKFDRFPRSVISLDTVSVGIAHHWAGSVADDLVDIVKALPELAEQAWGDNAQRMLDEDWTEDLFRPRKGKMAMQARLNWYISGWRFLMGNPEAIRFHANDWLRDYVKGGHRLVSKFGWKKELRGSAGGQILAASVRLMNSGRAYTRVRNGMDKAGKGASAMKILEATYNLPRSEGGYGKPARWKKITTWKGFQGPAPRTTSV
jgi:hypothetical protein